MRLRISLLLAAVFGLLLLSLLEPLWRAPPGWQTSYSYTPSGHRAVYELLDHFRGDVERWRRLPESLDGDGRALLLIEPDGPMMLQSEAALEDLLAWVEGGNDLILVPRHRQVDVAEVLGQEFEVDTMRLDWEDLLEDLLPLLGIQDKFMLDLPEYDPALDRPTDLSRPPMNMSAVDGSGNWRVDLSARYRPVEGLAATHGIPLFSIEGEVAALEYPLGHGHVVLLLTPTLFLNKDLARQDHAAAVLAMLQPYGERGLLVDEFFHGLPAVGGLLQLLFRPPFLWLTLSLLLLSAFLLWSAAIRLEPLAGPRPPSRRSKREHLDSMGHLLASSRRPGWIARRLRLGLESDLRSFLRLPNRTPLPMALGYLRRRDIALAKEFEEVHAEGELVERRARGDRAWEQWGSRLHRLRQAMNHESDIRTVRPRKD